MRCLHGHASSRQHTCTPAAVLHCSLGSETACFEQIVKSSLLFRSCPRNLKQLTILACFGPKHSSRLGLTCALQDGEHVCAAGGPAWVCGQGGHLPRAQGDRGDAARLRAPRRPQVLAPQVPRAGVGRRQIPLRCRAVLWQAPGALQVRPLFTLSQFLALSSTRPRTWASTML